MVVLGEVFILDGEGNVGAQPMKSQDQLLEFPARFELAYTMTINPLF